MPEETPHLAGARFDRGSGAIRELHEVRAQQRIDIWVLGVRAFGRRPRGADLGFLHEQW